MTNRMMLSTGMIVAEPRLMSGNQFEDANGVPLVFTKTKGKPWISAERDVFTATGTNTQGYSWTYYGEALDLSPARILITVYKTPL